MAVPPSPETGPAAATRRDPATFIATAALWLVAGVLATVLGVVFLNACAVRGIAGLDFCPVPRDHRALIEQIGIGQSLQEQVHMAEMSIAQKPLCQPQPTVTPPPHQHLAPPPPDPTQQRATEQINRQVITRGGHNGNLQFTLLWNTLDDLDLNVDCPGGRIDSTPGHKGPGICGDGVKDLDANRNLNENVSTNPVENVVWQHDIPEGTYRIEVIEFMAKHASGGSVPYTLRLHWNDQERICHGQVNNLAPLERYQEGDATISGTYQTLTWTFGSDFPNCDFVDEKAHLGGFK